MTATVTRVTTEKNTSSATMSSSHVLASSLAVVLRIPEDERPCRRQPRFSACMPVCSLPLVESACRVHYPYLMYTRRLPSGNSWANKETVRVSSHLILTGSLHEHIVKSLLNEIVSSYGENMYFVQYPIGCRLGESFEGCAARPS